MTGKSTGKIMTIYSGKGKAMSKKTKVEVIAELEALGAPIRDEAAYNELCAQLKAWGTDEEAGKTQKAPLKEHEIRELEVRIRKFVKRDGGFRKGVSTADAVATTKLLKELGRKGIAWDETIDCGPMVQEKSKVVPKAGKNSID